MVPGLLNIKTPYCFFLGGFLFNRQFNSISDILSHLPVRDGENGQTVQTIKEDPHTAPVASTTEALSVCLFVLRFYLFSESNGVMSNLVSLPNHIFSGQA